MVLRVKDPALSLLWLWLQLWCGSTFVQELPHASDMTKKKKPTKRPPPKKNYDIYPYCLKCLFYTYCKSSL